MRAPAAPPKPRRRSNDPADLLTPGVVTEVDPETAAELGAFEEDALTEADAWEANDDLPDASGDKTPPQTDQRVYLTVPYAEKDEAKAFGAKWDREAKSWYAPAGVDLDAMRRWIPALRESVTPAAQDPREAFRDALAEAGFRLDGLPEMDGALHRVPVEGDKGRERSGAYVGYLDGRPAGFMQNFRTGQKTTWKAEQAADLDTALDYAKLAAEAAERRATREQQLQVEYAAAAQAAEAQFEGAAEIAEHPYLARKGVGGYGVRQGKDGRLLVPICDLDGKLWSYQAISEDGTKQFMKGGRVQGGQHQIGDFGETTPIIIAEGYATAATLHELTGYPAAIAFTASNLRPVAEALRGRYPDREIIIAGDNDRGREEAGQVNVGREKAEEAAQAIGGLVVLPPFERGGEGSDWNDLARSAGRGLARAAFASGRAEAEQDLLAERQLLGLGAGAGQEPSGAIDQGRQPEVIGEADIEL